MARHTFGGDVASLAVSVAVNKSLSANNGVVVTFANAQTGGSSVTDLLAADGTTPITSVTTGSDGTLPVFYGPDGTTQLWAIVPGAASRRLILATDVSATYGALASDNAWLGRQNLGDATHEAMIQWWGNGSKVQWQTAIDVANAPTYTDLVLAARAETWDAGGNPTSVSDFLVVRDGHSQSNPPRLGVGTYPTDASNGALPQHPGMLEVAIYGTTNGATFTNIVAAIRETAPAQTGFAFAAVGENGHAKWSVGVDGTVKVYDSAENPQVTLSPTAGIASVHDITANTEIRARFGDSSNVTIIGEVGPSSQPGLQVVNAGTTWYRASDYHWQTPGYVTIDRNVSVGGSGADAEVVLTVDGHSSTQTGDLAQLRVNSANVARINAKGALITKDSTAVVVGDLVDGEMALVTDASGNLKVYSRVGGVLKSATVTVA